MLESFNLDDIKELIHKVPVEQHRNLESRLDEILPPVEPGGFKIHLNSKNYSLMFKKSNKNFCVAQRSILER